jgi:hypothetical protein
VTSANIFAKNDGADDEHAVVVMCGGKIRSLAKSPHPGMTRRYSELLAAGATHCGMDALHENENDREGD